MSLALYLNGRGVEGVTALQKSLLFRLVPRSRLGTASVDGSRVFLLPLPLDVIMAETGPECRWTHLFDLLQRVTGWLSDGTAKKILAADREHYLPFQHTTASLRPAEALHSGLEGGGLPCCQPTPGVPKKSAT